MEILGDCFGVRLEQRGRNDKHVLVRLLSEDDEHWIESDYTISSYWLDDMLDVLSRVKHALEGSQFEPDLADPALGYAPGRSFGYKFKERS